MQRGIENNIFFLFSTVLSTAMATTPTDLENCMETLIKVFRRYAEKGSDGNNLTKKELNTLLKTELPSFLAVKFSIVFPPMLSQFQSTFYSTALASTPSISMSLSLRPRRTPKLWTRSCPTWTTTKMKRWTLKNLLASSRASQPSVSGFITSRRSEGQIPQRKKNGIIITLCQHLK